MTVAEDCARLGVNWHLCSDADEQVQWLAGQVADVLQDAIARNAVAHLAVSGGRSPEAFLRQLAGYELDWSAVRLTLVDERWVPPAHSDSNAGLVQRCLAERWHSLQWLPLYRGDSPVADARAAAAELASWGRLDAVVLGMGADGHTASLFPDLPDWPALCAASNPDYCVALPATGSRQPRLSLTGRLLHSAPRQLLALSGQAKLDTLQRACDAPSALPVGAFLKPPLDIVYSP
ncbi:MAG: 6-phosphogluconolactonase [Gammaproteobacteria bacterium]|nr:6-phosphogluconolactonase [Gammaproteobacteria bacterium]